MLFHASIPAADTRLVASVLAELWAGSYAPFPPFPGSHIAFAGDDRGTEIEVFPRSQENIIGASEVEARHDSNASGYSAVHLAIATPLSAEQVLSIAAREGWTSRVCDRAGCFHVIEVWLEDRFLVEVLTPSMQQEYLTFMSPASWQSTFGGVVAAPETLSSAVGQ